MTRWIGSSGETKTTGEKDLTGTSFNERCKSNTRNLDDMIHYLEYRKNTGYAAARVNEEQEEYWAMLIRHLLMDRIVKNLVPLYERRKITGVKFTCFCSYESEVRFVFNVYKVGNQDSYEIIKHCKCGFTKERENDILEYVEFIIKGWNEKMNNLEKLYGRSDIEGEHHSQFCNCEKCNKDEVYSPLDADK